MEWSMELHMKNEIPSQELEFKYPVCLYHMYLEIFIFSV